VCLLDKGPRVKAQFHEHGVRQTEFTPLAGLIDGQPLLGSAPSLEGYVTRRQPGPDRWDQGGTTGFWYQFDRLETSSRGCLSRRPPILKSEDRCRGWRGSAGAKAKGHVGQALADSGPPLEGQGPRRRRTRRSTQGHQGLSTRGGERCRSLRPTDLTPLATKVLSSIGEGRPRWHLRRGSEAWRRRGRGAGDTVGDPIVGTLGRRPHGSTVDLRGHQQVPSIPTRGGYVTTRLGSQRPAPLLNVNDKSLERQVKVVGHGGCQLARRPPPPEDPVRLARVPEIRLAGQSCPHLRCVDETLCLGEGGERNQSAPSAG